jgi:hypothetical protein
VPSSGSDSSSSASTGSTRRPRVVAEASTRSPDANTARRADDSERVARLGEHLPARRGRQRRGRRIAATRDTAVDQRAHPRRQQVLVRGQRPVRFDREVAPGQRRATHEPANDVGCEAARGEERRLHGERLELLARAGIRIEEDPPAVGPRRRAAIAARHFYGAAGEGRRQQAKPSEAARPLLRRASGAAISSGP